TDPVTNSESHTYFDCGGTVQPPVAKCGEEMYLVAGVNWYRPPPFWLEPASGVVANCPGQRPPPSVTLGLKWDSWRTLPRTPAANAAAGPGARVPAASLTSAN